MESHCLSVKLKRGAVELCFTVYLLNVDEVYGYPVGKYSKPKYPLRAFAGNANKSCIFI
ncbi:hypothetical protein SA20RB_205 [Escherichia phage vB_EcoM_SA20RB]|nr:hypothetical protein SA20RB_205 [Escherichia phage vB_EcoM_SA20RB]